MIYIFILELFLVLQSMEASAAAGTPNVGTVLFTSADVDNKIWTKHNLALLKARLYFQHLLPPFISPQTPDYVDSLLKYFKDGYVSISQDSADLETDKILTSAFTDIIGGYLKMFALPITKYAYYGGTLPKPDAIKLFLFYEDVKKYLGSNGTGWAAPDMSVLSSVTVNVAVSPATQARSMSDPDSCHHITYFEKTASGLTVPTPVIDWPSQTMFMPFASQPVVNLRSPDASDALHNYYRTATHCIRSAMPYEFDNFDEHFQEWLHDVVVPHLDDDPLYAALQGVLSLINQSSDPHAINSYNDVLTALAEQSNKKCEKKTNFTKKQILIMIIVALEILCCVPTLLYVLCRVKKQSKKHSRTSSVKVLLESRSDKNDSEFSDALSKSHSRKRYGGVKLEQKPYSLMEIGEVYSSHSFRSVYTETAGPRVLRRCQNAATMVNEVAALKSRRSTQVQTTGNHVVPATKTETSDDTGKTFTLSSISPSKATTVKISHPIKEATDGGSSITASRMKRSVSSKTLKKELSKERNTKGEKTADFLISQICNENVEIMQPTPVAKPSEKEVRKSEKRVKEVKKASFTGFKIHNEDNTFKLHGADKPYLEIRIGRPQHEISVGISQNEQKEQKMESHVHKRARGSRIPKKAPGSQVAQIKVTRLKEKMTEARQEAVFHRKSMIPKLKRAVDDTVLQENKGTIPPKLNVTL